MNTTRSTGTKNRMYHMVQIKRVSLTEKLMVCLINKCCSIFLTQSKQNGIFTIAFK